MLQRPRFFGVNQRIIPKIDLKLELLPRPFTASRDPVVLKSNIGIALQLLGVSATRDWVVGCDETCVHPTLDIVAGLREEAMAYVGGYFSDLVVPVHFFYRVFLVLQTGALNVPSTSSESQNDSQLIARNHQK